MGNIEDLKRLVMASESLAGDEKQVICLLLPYMKEADSKRIFEILSSEKAVSDSLPHINAELAEELKKAFEASVAVYGGYKKSVVMEVEENIKRKETENAENIINNL